MSDTSKRGSSLGIPMAPVGGAKLSPPFTKPADAKRHALDAATSRALTTAVKPAAQPNRKSLDIITKNVAENDAFYKQPFLVTIILDLTSSRATTRPLMIQYEKEIARLVMEAGGRHPVICRGIYHRGGKSSDPIDLTTAQAIENFFGLSDSAGGTAIQPGLEAYLAHPAKALLSLGVVIGDSIDGDSAKALTAVAEKLNRAGRPFVFACEDTSTEGHFVNAMQDISGASGGFAFDLAKEPSALIDLLKGYKKIFSTPPEDLRRQTQLTRGAGKKALPPGRTQQFLDSQATRLLLGYDKKQA